MVFASLPNNVFFITIINNQLLLKCQTPQESFQVLESLPRRQQKLWSKEHEVLQSSKVNQTAVKGFE